MKTYALTILTSGALMLGACIPVTTPTDSNTTDANSCSIPTLSGTCDPNVTVGSFTLVHEDGYSVISGQVADGVVPATILKQVGQNGNCTLLQQMSPFCNPSCAAGTTCNYDGTCIPYPNPVNVGTVVVKGLKTSVEMSPVGASLTYFDTQLPHPAFDAGACIELTAAGATIAGFTLHGTGVTPLVIPDTTLVMRYGQPLTVTWTAAADNQARILLSLNIDQHGLTPVTLVCDVEDTGAFSVPKEMVNALMDFGYTGLAKADIYRQTVDSVSTVYGCVEFKVMSHRELTLQVE